MAENTKTFSIVINGIQESVKAVDSLNDALGMLEQRMKAVQSSTVSVGAGGGSTNVSALKEQDQLMKQIQKSEQDLINAQREEYQGLLANKDLIKQAKTEAESRAAAERLAANNYAETMESVKAKLADIKKVMQTTDMGSEKFRELAVEANALNTKLKEAEESYGQFGRNVGNYASAAEGFTKVKVQVGDTVREFNNAREASRQLSMELKSMAVNGEQGTQSFKDMQVAVAQLNSDIKDATVSSQAMDNLLDTMQSFGAIGQVTQGLSALLGFDDSEIEKSIQKLVALQNAMQGLETIQQQMNSGEGIGGWISKGNAAIDKFVEGLFGAKEATEAVTTATEAAKTVTEADTAAQAANNTTKTAGATSTKALTTATQAQTVATKATTVATKGLSFALKTLGIGLIISAVAYLVTYWEDIYGWFVKTIPALKNLGTWFNNIKKVMMGVGNAVINFVVQPFATLGKTILALIKGNFAEIPKIISEGLKKQYNVIGNFQKGYNKEEERQQKKHNDKMREQNLKSLEERKKDEDAKYGQSLDRDKKYYADRLKFLKKGSADYNEAQRKLWETERKIREKGQKGGGGGTTRTTNTTVKQDVKEEVDDYGKEFEAQMEALNRTLYKNQVETARDIIKNDLDKTLSNLPIPQFDSNNVSRSLENYRNYWEQIRQAKLQASNKLKEIDAENLRANYSGQVSDENSRYEKQIDDLKKALDEKKITQEQYNKYEEEATKTHNELLRNYQEQYNVDSQTLEKKNTKERLDINKDFYKNYLSDVSKEQKKIMDRIKNPVMTSIGTINYGATKEERQKALSDLQSLYVKLVSQKKKLKEELENTELTPEEIGAKKQQLEAVEKQMEGVELAIDETKDKMKNGLAEWINKARKYIDAVSQAFASIMEAVWSAQDAQFDKEQEDLDKWNEELEKKLDEQQDIVEQHKDNINSIEDELATARGDRRARLIDQLNAEIAAQRAAQAQEEVIEKQKETAEKKQEELDKKRKKAEYERNIIQAIVNGALGITFALANPFPENLIFAAIVGAQTAAQLAIMMANKPYEKGGQLDGGVAQGKRHRDGGIPVLGGRATIEGGEFITNRRTTADNVDLLEYINSKHRKLNMDDFINFYGGEKTRKAITSTTTKFADGGQVPTLSNDINVDDKLTAAFEEYANRPIYVAVTEIEKKQASLNRVRALAGVE